MRLPFFELLLQNLASQYGAQIFPVVQPQI